jgi:hypothetical protein
MRCDRSPPRNGQRHALRLGQGLADGNHVQPGERPYHRHGHQHRQPEQPFGLGSRLLLLLHRCPDLVLQNGPQLLQQLVSRFHLGHCLATVAAGHGGQVHPPGLQLAGHARELLAVAVQPLHQAAGHGVVLVLGTLRELAGHLLGLFQAGQPAGVGLLDRIGVPLLDDHVLFMQADRTQGTAQFTQLFHFGELVGHKVTTHGLNAKHAKHPGTAQHAQQAQHHGNGTEHAKADGEQPHERKKRHGGLPLLS